MGLLHISEGNKKNRQVVVKKKQVKEQKSSRNMTENIEKTASETKMDNLYNILEVDNAADVENKLIKSSKKNKMEPDNTCKTCGRYIPSGNLTLHKLRCNNTESSSKKSTRPKMKTDAHIKKEKLKKSRVENLGSDGDFDSLIEAAMNDNKSCAYTRCKKSTSTLGQVCNFCSKIFCLSHHIAEVHGCGDAARHKARTVIIEDGVIHRGSGRPSKKPDEVTRTHLQRKLQAKLNDKTVGREKKQKKH